MNAEFDAALAQTTHAFAALNLRVDEAILAQLIGSGDAYCGGRFAIDADCLLELGAAFRAEPTLRQDFEKAIRAHRPERHWSELLQFAYEIGNLQGHILMLARGLSCPCPEERSRLARRLNDLDGELSLRHDMADRRNLARRICGSAGIPVTDGLTIRGLTFTLAEQSDLFASWQRWLDSPLSCNAANPVSTKHAQKP